MAVEFTQEVTKRLESDQYGWLTTVAKSGQPVPRLVWFYFDGSDGLELARRMESGADAAASRE